MTIFLDVTVSSGSSSSDGVLENERLRTGHFNLTCIILVRAEQESTLSHCEL